MSSSEFSIIDEFFSIQSAFDYPPVVGIGDDCAVLDVPSDKQLAVTTDTLVESVHFLPNSDPYLLGKKALAVNLSDLAAMGSVPAWVSLAITLPVIDKTWLSNFSRGLFELAGKHGVQLIGGDTTSGPLAITITAMGLLPKNKRLTRCGARVGDSIYVSGMIGNAGLGLEKAKAGSEDMSDRDVEAYLAPTPRVNLGCLLLGNATSCIDVSDGLSADLNHILKASGVGASIVNNDLPLTDSIRNHISSLSDELWPYSTGDDYELCFTLPNNMSTDFMRQLDGYDVTKIGCITEGSLLQIQLQNGEHVELNRGYDHFKV